MIKFKEKVVQSIKEKSQTYPMKDYKSVPSYEKFKDNTDAVKALEIIQHTNLPVFITGNAGTGKSLLINYIEELCIPYAHIVAPTGISAHNVGGSTIHSHFHLPPKLQMPTGDFLGKIRFSKDYIMELAYAQLLLVDEVSMVNSPTLDCMDRILKDIFGNNEPFGGKQVVFVGDVFQISPVLNKDELAIVKSYYESEYFFDSEIYQEIDPIVVHLRTSYRQNDSRFLELLNNVRLNINVSEGLKEINRHCAKGSVISGGSNNSIILGFRNNVVDNYNQKMLNSLNGDLKTFIAKESGAFKWAGVLAEKELCLKEGARIMLLKNHPAGLYRNGTLGYVTSLAENKIVVTSDEGNTFPVEKEIWTTNGYERDHYKKEMVSKTVGEMTQYPLKLGWAISVHKSQGMTFNNVHLLNDGNAFACGQTYVALSRCRSLEGLTLHRPLSVKDIKISPEVSIFHNGGKEDKRLPIVMKTIQEMRA